MKIITDTLKQHTELSMKMLKNIIISCPDERWNGNCENDTIWKRIIHTLESVDYWLVDFSKYHFKSIFKDLSAEMNQVNKQVLSKNETLEYFNLIHKKVEIFFCEIDDTILRKNSFSYPKCTYLDIILCQIRHIQINTGYCHEMFKSNGLQSPEWVGYNES